MNAARPGHARPRTPGLALALTWLLAGSACTSGGAPPGPTAPDDARLTPLARDRRAHRAPKLADLQMDRAAADALRASLQRLPKFPIRLSELEAHYGRPLRRHFNPESFDPTFVHDRGGKGVNNGGEPVFHPSVDPGTPLLVELRSQYYARYDEERKFDRRPPFAADDPIIDLITISDGYAHGAPPPAPSKTIFEGDYAYIAEQWSIAPLQGGYVSLLTHDRKVNPAAERWIFTITVDRGFFHSPEEVELAETTLSGFVRAIRDGMDVPTLLAGFERDHADHFDSGILTLGLASLNIRFFDVNLFDGPHAGDFLRQEGLARALYIDANIVGNARVPLPRFYRELGFESVTLDPAGVREVAPGLRDGGMQFYDDVTVERDGWTVRATGFYPIEAGKAATTLDLSRFLVRSLTIRHEVR